MLILRKKFLIFGEKDRFVLTIFCSVVGKRKTLNTHSNFLNNTAILTEKNLIRNGKTIFFHGSFDMVGTWCPE